MPRYVVSFGWGHKHEMGGQVYDKECLAEFEAESEEACAALAFRLFGKSWCNIYEPEKIASVLFLYSRGIVSGEAALRHAARMTSYFEYAADSLDELICALEETKCYEAAADAEEEKPCQ